MTGVLVIAEHRQGELRPITRELASAAATYGQPVALAIVGSTAEALGEAASLAGVDEVIVASSASEEFDSHLWCNAAAELIAARDPDLVLVGHTVDSMSFAPAVAAKLGLGFASDVVSFRAVDGELRAVRPFYGGKVEGELEFPSGRPVMMMLRPGTWPEAEAGPTTPRTTFPSSAGATPIRHLGFREPARGDLDITSAPFLLSIGRGVGEQDAIAQFENLAGALGATLACSRPLVDAGWLDEARQVGQSGTTVTPKVYLAFGISGAVQHLAGMKAAGTIIAVNSDPEAAIFSVAHYGAVCDLFDVADELEALA
jgi:electron transfer flavoprotein alpha subunit